LVVSSEIHLKCIIIVEKTAMGKGGLTKWFKMAEEYSTLRFVEYREE
jgi:hypothetical protein